MAVSFNRSKYFLLDAFTIMIVMVITMSAIIFHCEKDVNKNYPNIFSVLKFVIITITSVGSDEQVPVTTAGKVACAIAMLCGVLLISITIPAISCEFMELYLVYRNECKLPVSIMNRISMTGVRKSMTDLFAQRMSLTVAVEKFKNALAVGIQKAASSDISGNRTSKKKCSDFLEASSGAEGLRRSLIGMTKKTF